jgi:hypothetical protein
MFTSEGPHIVMSRTDAQNGLDFHFKVNAFPFKNKDKSHIFHVKATLSQCFSTNQISLLQIFALWLQKIALWLQKIAPWLQKIALWLQKIALLFGINCTEINQSQSSNIFMYILQTLLNTS